MSLATEQLADSPEVLVLFQETVDGGTATDSSGNGHTFTRTGAGTSLGNAGLFPAGGGDFSAEFDGVFFQDYWLTNGDTTDTGLDVGTGDYCYEFVSSFYADTSNYWEVMGRDSGETGNGQIVFLETGTGRVRGYAGGAAVSGTTNVADGAVHLCGVERESGVLNIYVDGVLEASVGATGSTNGVTRPFRIGTLGTAPGAFPGMGGFLSHVAYYKHAIGATRHADHFASMAPTSAEITAELGLTIGFTASLETPLPPAELTTSLGITIGFDAIPETPTAPGEIAVSLGLTVGFRADFTGFTPRPNPIIALPPVTLTLLLTDPDVRLSSEDRPTGLTAKLYRGTDLVHPVAVLTGARAREGRMALSDAGTGQMTIPNSHADRALVQANDVVRYELDGEAIHQWVVTRRTSRTLRAAQHDRTTTLTGPGILGLLAEGLVLPSLGPDRWPIETDRVWSWISPTPIFDDSAWAGATFITTVGAARDDWPFLPFGTNFPTVANGADVLGPSVGTIDNAPAGACYIRQDFTVPETNTYAIYCLIDNYGEVYIDGISVANVRPEDGFQRATFETLQLSAGDPHTIACKVVNAIDTEEEGGNPIGFAFSIHRLNIDGTPGNAVATSDAGDAVIVEYPPSPPGMTFGEVAFGVREENQAIGLLQGLEYTFTKTTDSNGTPWPYQEWGTNVGRDVRTFFLDELASTYIDVRGHNGGFVMDATILDQLGTTSTLDLHPATDRDPATATLLELEHVEEAPRGSVSLTRWSGGWLIRGLVLPDSRPRGVLLGLGAQPSREAAVTVTDGELVRFRQARTAITAQPTREIDVRDANVGDRITVPDWDLDASVERVLAWTFTEDEHGTLTWAPELKNILLQEEERWENALKKLSDGTVRGASKVAQPASIASVGQCCVPQPAIEE